MECAVPSQRERSIAKVKTSDAYIIIMVVNYMYMLHAEHVTCGEGGVVVCSCVGVSSFFLFLFLILSFVHCGVLFK